MNDKTRFNALLERLIDWRKLADEDDTLELDLGEINILLDGIAILREDEPEDLPEDLPEDEQE